VPKAPEGWRSPGRWREFPGLPIGAKPLGVRRPSAAFVGDGLLFCDDASHLVAG